MKAVSDHSAQVFLRLHVAALLTHSVSIYLPYRLEYILIHTYIQKCVPAAGLCFRAQSSDITSSVSSLLSIFDLYFVLSVLQQRKQE